VREAEPGKRSQGKGAREKGPRKRSPEREAKKWVGVAKRSTVSKKNIANQTIKRERP
jgi:hypothetical protein